MPGVYSSPEGTYVFCLEGREIEVWDVATGVKLRSLARAPGLFASPDGEYVLFLVEPKVQVWDITTGNKLNSLRAELGWTMQSATLDVSKRKLVASYMNRDTDSVGWALWNLGTDADDPAYQVDMPSLGNTYSHGLDVARQGNQMAIGFDEALLVYEMGTYKRHQLPRARLDEGGQL